MSAPASSSSSSTPFSSPVGTAAAGAPRSNGVEQSGPSHAPPPQSQAQPADAAGEEQKEQRETPAERDAVRRVHLYRHAQESVFAFLRFNQLATMLAVSRDWQAAVGSMRSFGRYVHIISLALLQQLVSSRMSHHVAGIGFWQEHPLTVERLAVLHDRVPRLLTLRGDSFTIASGVNALHFPPGLTNLALENTYMATQEYNTLLRSIGGLTQLRQLTLCLRRDATLSFAPLALLPMLRVLRVAWMGFFSQPLSDAQVDQLRALVDLEEFSMELDLTNSIQHLLRLPHALQWKRMPKLKFFHDSMSALLPGLSCLTELNLADVSCTHFDFLPRIQRLAKLTVSMASLSHPADLTATQRLLDALQHCRALTSLELSVEYRNLTSDGLAVCLAGMPALSELQISSTPLPSLAFLALPSLAQSLRSLVLDGLNFPQPRASQLQYLHGLHSLRRLKVSHALSPRPRDAALAAFEPPSLLLPLLESFTCYPLRSESDEDEEDSEEDVENQQEYSSRDVCARASAR